MTALLSSRPHCVRAVHAPSHWTFPAALIHGYYTISQPGTEAGACAVTWASTTAEGETGVCAGWALPLVLRDPAGPLLPLAQVSHSGDPAGQRQSWTVSKVTGVYYPPGEGGAGGRKQVASPFPQMPSPGALLMQLMTAATKQGSPLWLGASGRGRPGASGARALWS